VISKFKGRISQNRFVWEYPSE